MLYRGVVDSRSRSTHSGGEGRNTRTNRCQPLDERWRDSKQAEMPGSLGEVGDGIRRGNLGASQALAACAEGHRGGTMEQLKLFDEDLDDQGLFVLEEAVRPSNLLKAYQRVKRNKGAPGPDGMTVKELGVFLSFNLEKLRASLLSGSYQPQPVRKKEISKPGGGKRKLGIPSVLDRLVQQALLQTLTPIFDPTFSEYSYGFRPGRGTQDAVLQAREFVAQGNRWVVDIDLEKFFDCVNHDILMSRVARKVKDRKALRLIRQFLKAGILANGLVEATEEGTPQGGPLSPLLSNVLLNELDQELESRGHHFCRYADDANIYVRSQRAGERVMQSVTNFLETRLKLRVNPAKSAVGRPWKRQFLGYSMTSNRNPKLRVSPDREKRLKKELRPLLRAGRGRSVSDSLCRLASKIRGWVSYFKLCDVKAAFERLDFWLRRRIRAIFWRQWKRYRTRLKEMVKRGIEYVRAKKSAGNGRGPWWNSRASHMNQAVPNRELRRLGYVSFLEEFQSLKCSTG